MADARILPHSGKSVKIKIEEGVKKIYLPEEKFKRLFPIAWRRGLEVTVIYEDDRFIIAATTLPEQRQPRLKKVAKVVLFGDVKKMVEVV